MTGRMYPEFWGKLSGIIIFVGFNLTFFPQFILGYLGMPRRYHFYYQSPEWQIYHILSTAGSTILGFGYLLPVFYLTWSLFKGPKAPQNPWGATGLEWTKAATPPVTENFTEKIIVTEDAYNYDSEADSQLTRDRRDKVGKALGGEDWWKDETEAGDED